MLGCCRCHRRCHYRCRCRCRCRLLFVVWCLLFVCLFIYLFVDCSCLVVVCLLFVCCLFAFFVDVFVCCVLFVLLFVVFVCFVICFHCMICTGKRTWTCGNPAIGIRDVQYCKVPRLGRPCQKYPGHIFGKEHRKIRKVHTPSTLSPPTRSCIELDLAGSDSEAANMFLFGNLAFSLNS